MSATQGAAIRLRAFGAANNCEKLPADGISAKPPAGYNITVIDPGYSGVDSAGVFFLVAAAVLFAWAWYRRAFAFRFNTTEDEQASWALLAASESKIASRSVENNSLTPSGQRLMLAVFFVLVVLMVASPIVTVMVAENSVKHASSGYNYAQSSPAPPSHSPLP